MHEAERVRGRNHVLEPGASIDSEGGTLTTTTLLRRPEKILALLIAATCGAALVCAHSLPAAGQPPAPSQPSPPSPAVDRGEVLERLGIASMQVKDYERAVANFRAAIAAGRDHALLRQNLGFALAELNRCDEAITELEVSVQREPAPRAYMFMGRCYERLRKPGLAITALERALPRLAELPATEQRDVYRSLGYLYAEDGQNARAAEAWTHALDLAYDPKTAIALGRVQRLGGDRTAARRTLESVPTRDLSRSDQAARLDELAALDRDERKLPDSVTALEQATTLEPTAQREYALGLAFRDLKQRREAVTHLERARALAPDETKYAAELGYAYKAAGRLPEAAKTFEAVLARDPDYVALYEELAYTYMAMSDTSRAVEWFKKGIDNAARYPTATRAATVARMKDEVTRLTKSFDVTAYVTYRTSSDQPTTGSAGLLGGALPAQSGLEASYRPPVIGFRDERIFQIFARLLWNFEPSSFEIDEHSVQAGVGLRYKPLRSQNLFLSAERLFAIGENAFDDWLLRAMYSWEYGPRPRGAGDYSNYTTLFLDAGYFTKPLWAFYGEAREGLTWNLTERILVTPHAVLDARYQETHGKKDSFVEGGGGLSLKYLFRDGPYETYRSNIELLIQYKAGVFLERATTPGHGDEFHGLVLTGILRF